MECRVQKGAKNRNNAAQVISSLAAYACPLIGKKPVTDISTDDFLVAVALPPAKGRPSER